MSPTKWVRNLFGLHVHTWSAIPEPDDPSQSTPSEHWRLVLCGRRCQYCGEVQIFEGPGIGWIVVKKGERNDLPKV